MPPGCEGAELGFDRHADGWAAAWRSPILATLRHDHGSAFMADHFQHQIKFWGMAASFAFVGEPETNGVAERSAARTSSMV